VNLEFEASVKADNRHGDLSSAITRTTGTDITDRIVGSPAKAADGAQACEFNKCKSSVAQKGELMDLQPQGKAWVGDVRNMI
jgi:hypothetical protein